VRGIRHDLNDEETCYIAPEVEHARHLASKLTDETELLLRTLGAFDHFRGNRKLAVKDWERILEFVKSKYGPDHPATLTSMNNLALTLWNMGDNQGARKLQEQVLERMTAILGPDHPDTTVSAWNLFATLHTMGERGSAQGIINEHLLWLLADGVKLHSDNQRQISEMLLQVLGIS